MQPTNPYLPPQTPPEPRTEGAQWANARDSHPGYGGAQRIISQQPPLNITPAGMRNSPSSGVAGMYFPPAKRPYDLSYLSQTHKESLKNHNLKMSIIPLTVIFGLFAIGWAWLFGIAAYFWSVWILLRHRSIFIKLPRIESRTHMPSWLGWLSLVPLLNFLIIPFSQDELRRQLNLQFSLREKMLPFSRGPIIGAAWTQSLSILLALPIIITIISYESLREWWVSIISLLWHIPIVLISIATLAFLLHVTNKSQKSWWPNKHKESKSGRDLVGVTTVPLLVTIISIFIMTMIILPIFGGDCTSSWENDYSCSYFDVGWQMQVRIFFPCAFAVLFGLNTRVDDSKQKNRRGRVYALYSALIALFAFVPYISLVTTFTSIALMVAAFVLIIIVEVLIGVSVNNLCRESSNFSNQTVFTLPPQTAAPQAPASQIYPQQVQPVQMDELTKTRKRFTRTQMFASGGMAAVFHCKDNADGSTKVWKQAQGEHIPLNDANKRLKFEAEVLMAANHPRIPTYFGFTDVENDDGKDENVLIMEYLEGGDLKATVAQVSKVGLSMPTDTIIDYLKAMCEPLVHMASFSEPIYHRDLKPHNVIIHPTRGPVIIDWGLAKAVQGGSDISVTRGGSGTWTSPERDSGISGSFTDVYSLGKVLYYLATCKQPPAIISTAEKDEMISSGRPIWLAELMIKSSWPRHQERIQTVKAFLGVLENQGESPAVEQPAESDDFTTWG